MNNRSGAFFLPVENLYYALSILGNTGVSVDTFTNRLTAFADLVECIVLSRAIVYDRGEAPIDVQLSHLVNEYNLDQVLVSRELTKTSLKGHLPHLLARAPDDVDMDDFDIGSILTRFIDESNSAGQSGIGRLLAQLENSPDLLSELQRALSLAEDVVGAVATDVLLSRKCEVLDFLKVVMPPLFGAEISDVSGIRHLEQALGINFSSWDDFFSKEERDLIPSEAQAALNLTLALEFQIMTETALSASLRDGFAFQPSPLQSNLILSRPLFAPSSTIFLEKLADRKIRALADLNDFLYNRHTRMVNLPILFNYILSRASSVKDIFDVSMELREQKEVRRYQEWCAEVDEALRNGYQEEALTMIDGVSGYIEAISRRTRKSVNVQVQLSFPPAIAFDVPPINLARKNHLVFLKQVYYGSRSPIILRARINKVFNARIEI